MDKASEYSMGYDQNLQIDWNYIRGSDISISLLSSNSTTFKAELNKIEDYFVVNRDDSFQEIQNFLVREDRIAYMIEYKPNTFYYYVAEIVEKTSMGITFEKSTKIHESSYNLQLVEFKRGHEYSLVYLYSKPTLIIKSISGQNNSIKEYKLSLRRAGKDISLIALYYKKFCYSQVISDLSSKVYIFQYCAGDTSASNLKSLSAEELTGIKGSVPL